MGSGGFGDSVRCDGGSGEFCDGRMCGCEDGASSGFCHTGIGGFGDSVRCGVCDRVSGGK